VCAGHILLLGRYDVLGMVRMGGKGIYIESLWDPIESGAGIAE
jgi:hypothetical protein